MPTGEANRLVPCNISSRICWYRKLYRDRGGRGSPVPLCNAVDVDIRHAQICPRAAVQMNQDQLSLHAIVRTWKQLEILHQVESGELFTAGRDLRIEIAIRRGGLRDAPNWEYTDRSTLLDITYADSQAQVHLRGVSAPPWGLLPLPPRRASFNTTLVRNMRPSNGATNSLSSGGKLWVPRGREYQLHRPAGSLASWGGGVEGRWQGKG